MKKLFAPLVGGASPVTVIGLCKNAGKTTALRRLMAELDGEALALTSVGRDGEATDLVTGTEKPELYLRQGDLYATARGLIPLCDATCAVEALTGVMTPLGEVAVFRALSDGFVQIAGPSSSAQLPPLCKTFYALGAKRILIDGAAGRKSLAGAGAAGCTILCTGASLDRDMDLAVAETAYVSGLFAAHRPANAGLCRALDETASRFALFTPEGTPVDLPLDEAKQPRWNKLPRIPLVLWAAGGITDPLVKLLARRGLPITLAAEDATHVLASRTVMEAFTRGGNILAVRQTLQLSAVAANPWSAYGWHYDGQTFLSRLRAAVTLPVVDVREEDSICS